MSSEVCRNDARMRTYSIVVDPDPDEGGFTVIVPALPGCVTQGETIEVRG